MKAETLQGIKKSFDTAFKPIIFGKNPKSGERDNILLRKPSDEAIKDLNTFLATKAKKFIGSDNKTRQADTEKAIKHFDYLLRGIVAVFGKLAIYAQRAEFAAPEQALSGAGSQEALTKRKETKLAKRKVDKVDASKIPWGASGQGGALTVSVRQAVGASLNIDTLNEMRTDIQFIKASINPGKDACLGSACKDRYDLLAYLVGNLEALMRKVEASIDELRDLEKSALAKRRLQALS